MSFRHFFVSDQPPGKADTRDFAQAVALGAVAGALNAALGHFGLLHVDPSYAFLVVGGLKHALAYVTGRPE